MSDDRAISVLIRTFNSGKTLEKVISRLDLLPEDRLIVVDSGSADHTLEIAGKYGAVVVIAEGKFHYSKSLNYGFREAKTPWVLVLSSHSIPIGKVGLLESFRSAMDHLPEDVVVAYGANSLTGKPDPRVDPDRVSIFSQADSWAEGIGGNPNALYRRAAWEQLAFDEVIRTGEDLVWMQTMAGRGFRYAYVPQALTVNRNRGTLLYMYRKGRSDMRAFKSEGSAMTFRDLAGALKNHARQMLKREIDWGTFIRLVAHCCGQFSGARMDKENRA